MAELRTIDCEPPMQGVRERLQELLEQVEKGELSAVAFAVVYRDGSPGCGYSRLPSRSTMIGSVELLKARIVNDWLEDNA